LRDTVIKRENIKLLLHAEMKYRIEFQMQFKTHMIPKDYSRVIQLYFTGVGVQYINKKTTKLFIYIFRH